MKFSLALTTFRSAQYLGVQLDSFLAQTRLPEELVVCDDGSTDGTLALLDEFRARAPFPVRIFRNEKNLGYSQNFARAIQLCEGDWIFLADHDDQWLPEKLALYEEKILADSSLVALFSDSLLVDNTLTSLGTTLFATNRFHDYERADLREGQAWRTFLRHNVVAGHTLAFRASLRDRLLPIPPGWVHDAWLASLLARLGKIDFLSEPLVHYRQHPHQHIGVITGGPFARLAARWQRVGERGQFSVEADKWRALAARPEWQNHAEAHEALSEKINWLEGRAALPRWRLLRIPFFLARAGLYFRFDNGWQTIIKDFLLR